MSSDDVDAIPGTFDGQPSIVLVPALDDDSAALIKEGLARRRLVASGQACPCGARIPRLNRQQRRAEASRRRKGLPVPMTYLAVRHEDDCPAVLPEVQRRGPDYVAWRPK